MPSRHNEFGSFSSIRRLVHVTDKDGYHEIHFEEMPHALGHFGGDFGGWEQRRRRSSRRHHLHGFSKRVLSPAVAEGWDLARTVREMMCPNCVATIILGNALMVTGRVHRGCQEAKKVSQN